MNNFLSQIPSLLLSLPIILLSLSLHECCHGYIAYKLGDPTARNLGRLTLNPLKHLDPIGFICMLLFHFGWANPVPINTRNFNKPRRDMALSAAAGPISNVLLALVFGGLLRLSLWATTSFFEDDLNAIWENIFTQNGFAVSSGFVIMSLVVMMLYLGVIINFSYAIFNLIPVPPLDGSRIFYVFLPPKWYFGVMKYERIIALVMLVLLWLDILTIPLGWAVNGLTNVTFFIFGMNDTSSTALALIRFFVNSFI